MIEWMIKKIGHKIVNMGVLIECYWGGAGFVDYLLRLGGGSFVN